MPARERLPIRNGDEGPADCYRPGVRATGSKTAHVSGPTASARLLHLLLDLGAPDARVKDLLASVGLTQSDVADPDARVPHAALEDLLRRGVALSGDPSLGLHLAELVRPGAFDVLECIARTSPTLQDALSMLGRYHRVLHDTWRLVVEVHGDQAVVSFGLGSPVRLSGTAAEFCMASLFLVARRTFGAELGVQEVCFEHAAPSDTREHVRIFRAPIRFGAPRNSVAFSASLLGLSLPKGDRDVCAVLERHAATLLERLPASSSVADRVRALILSELPRGNPTLDSTAKRLGASPRTVRRHLVEEGTTYQALLDGLREQLAIRYRDEGLSVEEVACALGFSEASALRRAFRRWTGRSMERRRR